MKSKIESLKCVTVHDWDLTNELDDLSILNITIENWYHLNDLYIEKIGLKNRVENKIKDYKKLAFATLNLALKPDNKGFIMEYKLAVQSITKEVKKVNEDTIYPALCSHYKFAIDKKSISVEDYLNMYLNLKKISNV